MDEPGYYILLICIHEPIEVEYGRRIARLEPGLHAYIGSAQGGVWARVRRHLSRNKKVRWHIDKLTSHPQAKVAAVVVCISNAQGLEPCIAGRLAGAGYRGPRGFGSTDDPSSPTHLFRISPECSIGIVEDVFGRVFRECCPHSAIVIERF